MVIPSTFASHQTMADTLKSGQTEKFFEVATSSEKMKATKGALNLMMVVSFCSVLAAGFAFYASQQLTAEVPHKVVKGNAVPCDAPVDYGIPMKGLGALFCILAVTQAMTAWKLKAGLRDAIVGQYHQMSGQAEVGLAEYQRGQEEAKSGTKTAMIVLAVHCVVLAFMIWGLVIWYKDPTRTLKPDDECYNPNAKWFMYVQCFYFCFMSPGGNILSLCPIKLFSC